MDKAGSNRHLRSEITSAVGRFVGGGVGANRLTGWGGADIMIPTTVDRGCRKAEIARKRKPLNLIRVMPA